METDVLSVTLTADGFVTDRPVRIRGVWMKGAGTVTDPVDFHNVATSGAVAAGNRKIRFYPTADIVNYALIPARGVRFEIAAYVLVGDAESVTIFYEG